MVRIVKKNIVVIGSSNVDYIMKMPRLPGVGETVTDAVFMQTFGGKGANQAVGAARAIVLATMIPRAGWWNNSGMRGFTLTSCFKRKAFQAEQPW
jgi:ribokinase